MRNLRRRLAQLAAFLDRSEQRGLGAAYLLDLARSRVGDEQDARVVVLLVGKAQQARLAQRIAAIA